MSTYDKKMQKLFENFRRSLNEADLFSPDGTINQKELSILFVAAAGGSKEHQKRLYYAADNLKAAGKNFSDADGTPMNSDAVAKAYGLEVGSDGKVTTPADQAKADGERAAQQMQQRNTQSQADIEKFFADRKADREARYAEDDARNKKRDAERAARYAKEDEERARMNEGNMKNEHMAIMDRLQEIMSEYRLTTDDVRTILGDMDAAQDYADPSMEEPTI